MNRILSIAVFYIIFILSSFAQSTSELLNQAPDISEDFKRYENTYFFADSLFSFDPKTASGTILWRRNQYFPAHAFNYTQDGLHRVPGNEFPGREYEANPVLPFSIQFISARTIRIKVQTGTTVLNNEEPSLMLVKEPDTDLSWQYTKTPKGHQYKNNYGTVTITEFPWAIEFRDASGKLLTKTRHEADRRPTYIHSLPFSFMRRGSDYTRSMAAVFNLNPDEKIFGGGESFTRLNKYGQKLNLYTSDPNGILAQGMYKPIPFFMSNRGYGMFLHTSAPVTCDFGHSYGSSNALYMADESLDAFVFLGAPKEILNEYTTITGKPPMPPLWSFGLWMSRITYFSEDDGRNVALKLRANRIPSDVLHFDTGWFETDWRCDYVFSKNRFKDPVKMIADLKDQGFKTCLWQLPYFVPKNNLFREIVDGGLHIKNSKGNIPYEDAVLDFTNPMTRNWYEDKIGNLLKMGVAAIKVDFGEAAPYKGIYANGRTGLYEHNLYPLRYNKIVSDLTKKINNESIIWARSTWAGSQRYPLHWGGDAESTNMGMEAQLRGGLSLGLSGFTFYSHDIGGFTMRTPEELYRRWLPFGVFSSHTRCHGQPPKEPWDYGDDFQNYFRKVVETRYKLMPYIYTQSQMSAAQGLPMMRALFINYPDDPGAWQVENEYLFGNDFLIAPILESSSSSRSVYLPKDNWIDYQTGKTYSAGWHTIPAGDIQAIILVRDGAIIPHIKLAQSTKDMDWSKIDLVSFSTGLNASGQLGSPLDDKINDLSITKKGKSFLLSDPNKSNKFTVIPYSIFLTNNLLPSK